ncbi:MAG: metalloregulator ArsR/SmtB family transcription factor [Candidatus Saccharibacteria bacterium]|nr:metalloregulator ArsR/SmtB family transcription factor [Candidatus Saccharibacteria bacterium]
MEHQSNHLQRVMQLLGDETRYKIFEILLEGDNLCVSEISSLLGISTAAVSQHFRMLELAGVVGKKRNGQKMCYRPQLEEPAVAAVAHLMKAHQPAELIT